MDPAEKTKMLVCYLVLFLGVSVLNCKARYSFKVLEGSRVVLLTDFFNSSTDVEKLYLSLEDRGLADVDLVLLQHGGPPSFHGSFNELSRRKDRSFRQVTDKELLPLLLAKKPSTLISVTQNADTPQILISAWRKGLFPFMREIVIWMTQGNAAAVSGTNGITLTSPGDLNSLSTLLDANHFASRKGHFISARNPVSAVVEVLQRRKSNVPRRERRAAPVIGNMTSNSAGNAVQSTPKANVTVSSTGNVVSTPPSGNAVQVTANLNATVSSATRVASTTFSEIVLLLTPSPSATVSNASQVASTSSSEIAVQLTPSPSATSSALVITSSKIARPPAGESTSFNVMIVSSSIAHPSASKALSSSTVASSLTSPPLSTSTPSSFSLVQNQVSTSTLVLQPSSVSHYDSSPVLSQPLVTSSVSSQTTLVVSASKTSSVSPSKSLRTSLMSSQMTLVVTALPTRSVSPSQSMVTSSVSRQTTLVVTASLTSSVSLSQPLGTSSVSSQTTLVVTPSPTSSVSPSQSLGTSLVSSQMTLAVTPSPTSSVLLSQPLGTSSVASQTTLVVTPSPTSSVSPSQSLGTSLVSSQTTLAVTPSPTSSVLLSQPLGTSSVSSQTTLVVTPSPTSSVSPSQSLGTSLVSSQTILAVTPSLTSSVFFSQPLGTTSVSNQTTLVVTPSPTSSVSPSQSLGTSLVSSQTTLVVTPSPTSSVSFSQPLGTSLVSSQMTLVVTPSPTSSVSPSKSLGTSSVLTQTTLAVTPSPTSSVSPSKSLGTSQTTLVFTASQTSSVSPSPSGNASLPSVSSSESSTTSSVATSVVTTRSAGVSSIVVISPSLTESQATPSSSKAVVTEPPPVYKNETMIIVFEGDCKDVVGIAQVEAEFKARFVEEVSTKLGIDESYIKVSNVECGSIKVTFTVAGASGKANVSQELKNLVKKGDIKVTVKGKTYGAKSIEVVQPTTTQTPTTEAPNNKIAFILYITFGSLMALIFIVGIAVLIVRCRKDRREGSFFLTQDTNYELRRFQGIPRARNYSKVNYYGEPVEHDATAADPNAPDEFQAQAEGYPYNQASSLDRVKPVAAATSDDKFNVGAMGLPEWKNLPKLPKSELTRFSDANQSIPQSSGSVGSRDQLLGDDSESSTENSNLGNGTSGADAVPTNDSDPVSTFGDGTSGLMPEANMKHAFDNPGLAKDDSS